MTNVLLRFNSFFLLAMLVLGLLLIGYQITVVNENGFFYLIGTGICLYCFNPFLLQVSYISMSIVNGIVIWS
jgi:hypothetical protein